MTVVWMEYWWWVDMCFGDLTAAFETGGRIDVDVCDVCLVR